MLHGKKSTIYYWKYIHVSNVIWQDLNYLRLNMTANKGNYLEDI